MDLSYVALYRKWRPRTFDEMVGQEAIRQTLKQAILSGKIAHAYLFSGPRGTGKTSTAKIFAKSLNCEQGPTPDPCNNCANCEKINQNASMDVFEIDAASNRGIDEIRDLRETVKFAPVDGRYKVYIIDEVHMLTTEAFNALLKTLEEPPEHVVFILATTEAHKIPATIHSRCQRYDFRRISVESILGRLRQVCEEQQIDAEEKALRLIAVQAEGGMRDALSLLDQCSSMTDSTVTEAEVRNLLGLIGQEWLERLVTPCIERQGETALLVLDELLRAGKDLRQILTELSLYGRSLLLYQASPSLCEATTVHNTEVLKGHSQLLTSQEIVQFVETCFQAAQEMKQVSEPRLVAELSLLRFCQRRTSSEQDLVERITELEKRLEQYELNQKVSAVRTVTQHSIAEIQAEARQPISIEPVKAGPAQKPAGPEAEIAIGDDLGKIWAKILQEILNQNKRSVHACVNQGQLVKLTDKVAILQFEAVFPKERTEKEDYKKIVENIIGQVTGYSPELRCTLASLASAKTGENMRALEMAKKMFGGKVIKADSPNE